MCPPDQEKIFSAANADKQLHIYVHTRLTECQKDCCAPKIEKTKETHFLTVSVSDSSSAAAPVSFLPRQTSPPANPATMPAPCTSVSISSSPSSPTPSMSAPSSSPSPSSSWPRAAFRRPAPSTTTPTPLSLAPASGPRRLLAAPPSSGGGRPSRSIEGDGTTDGDGAVAPNNRTAGTVSPSSSAAAGDPPPSGSLPLWLLPLLLLPFPVERWGAPPLLPRYAPVGGDRSAPSTRGGRADFFPALQDSSKPLLTLLPPWFLRGARTRKLDARPRASGARQAAAAFTVGAVSGTGFAAGSRGQRPRCPAALGRRGRRASLQHFVPARFWRIHGGYERKSTKTKTAR